MFTVDVHTHFVPPDLIADARRGDGFDGMRIDHVDGQEWLTHRQGYRYPLHRSFHDVTARLESMDERHIDHAVISIAPTLFMYWVGGQETIDFCRAANDSLAAFVAAAGGRMTAVATLPMRDPDAAERELRRAVAELGMRGAEIGPAIEDTPLDDPALRGVLRTAVELDVPLILHPYYVGSNAELADFYLTNLVGNPLATTVGAARLIFGGVLDELSSLRPVLMHGGGYLPYQIGRLDHGYRVRPESGTCRHQPSAYLDRFAYDTVTHAPAPLAFLIESVGARHVVFGTDFPFDMAAGPLDEQLARTGVDEGTAELIAGRNAAELFGLHLPGGSDRGRRSERNS